MRIWYSRTRYRNQIILVDYLYFRLTCGTTWHSAAMINTLRSSVNESKLMRHTRNVITRIEDETGVSPGWIKHGGLTITKNIKFLHELRLDSYLSKPVQLTELACLQSFFPIY